MGHPCQPYTSIRSVRVLLLLIAIVAISACQQLQPNTINIPAPQQLRLDEGQVNFLGHFNAKPKFSWQLPVHPDVAQQSHYQIQVASSRFTGSSDHADLWDTGKIASSQQHWLHYQGNKLDSRAQVFWRVRYWNEQNQVSKWQEGPAFELGLLSLNDWSAQWISIPDSGERDDTKAKNILYRPQYLRREFNIDQPVVRARLYVTAKGVFQAWLNGSKVGDDHMTPGWTPYDTRIETLTYDVTHLVSQGENAVGMIVADGWYAGRGFGIKPRTTPEPYALSQLELLLSDGSTRIIASDSSWRATRNGPLRFASNYDGEVYDARMEMPGWSTAGFDANAWQSVKTRPLDPGVHLQPKRHTTVKTKQHLLPIAVKVVDGAAIFDLGQNMVGVPKIQLPAIKGQQIRLRFAEALEHGEFYTDNYRSAHSTDYYIPASDGVVTYQPTFTFHGFRYVEITGYDSEKTPTLNWVQGVVQYSDFPLYAGFSSSHPKLKKLFENVEWGLRGNFLDIPTDCPQRDERMGWTGDAQVFATTSMYLADVYAFWAAWLQSLREEQGADGMIPFLVPQYSRGNTEAPKDGASSGWGDAATVIPWNLYQLTGDKDILRDNYKMMQGWVQYHKSQASNFISDMGSFGDWLQPYQVTESWAGGKRGDTDRTLIGTAYFARSVALTQKTAEALGYKADAQALEELHRDIKVRFQTHFFDRAMNVRVGEKTQTAYLMALGFDLLNDSQRRLAEQHLLDLIKIADNHLRTGFLGTPLLAPVLQAAGQSALMYKMLLKETYPSWFYSINQGATTTWERWNSYSLEEGFNKERMNSLNHYAYGAVAEWFFEGIAGIRILEPGFKRYRIDPQWQGPLQQASAGYPSPFGMVSVRWRKDKDLLRMEIEVAPNTEAEIVLPAGAGADITLNGVALEEAVSETNKLNLMQDKGSKILNGISPGKHILTFRFFDQSS